MEKKSIYRLVNGRKVLIISAVSLLLLTACGKPKNPEEKPPSGNDVVEPGGSGNSDSGSGTGSGNTEKPNENDGSGSGSGSGHVDSGESIDVSNLKKVERTEREVVKFEKRVEYTNSEKVGYSKLKQAGSNGEREVTYVDYVDESGKVVKTESVNIKITKNAQHEITIKGNKTIKTESKEVKIPFEVVYKEDSSMEKGQTRVVEGKDGIKEERYEVVLHGNKKVSRVLLSTITLKEPVDKIIYQGTKPVVRKTTKEVKNDIPYETVVYTSTQVSEEIVVSPGANGSSTTTYEITTTDGVETSRKDLGTVTNKNPEPRIVIVKGDSDSKEITYENFSNDIVTEFETIIEYNPNKLTTEETVLTEGQNGIVTESGTRVLLEGTNVKVINSKETVKQDKIDKVVEKGTIVYTTGVAAVESDIDFEVLTYYVPGYDGEDYVVKGEKGVLRTTYITHMYDNVEDESKREYQGEVITKDAKPQYVFTSDSSYPTLDYKEGSIDEAIPFDYEIVYQEDKFSDYEAITKEGELGIKRVKTFEIKMGESSYILTNTNSEIVKQPVKGEKHLGILVYQFSEPEDSVIPFEVITIEDETMEPGAAPIIKVQGENGILTTKYKTLYDIFGVKRGDKEVVETSVKKQPVSQEIVVPKFKSYVNEEKELELRDVDFEVIYEDDSSRPWDTPSEIKIAGEKGQVRDIAVEKYGIDEDGNRHLISTTIDRTVEVKPVVNQVVTRYTGHVTQQISKEVTIPKEIIRVPDETFTLLEGEEEVAQGYDGLVMEYYTQLVDINGNVIFSELLYDEQVRPKQDEFVTYGIAKIAYDSEVEVIPFSTDVEYVNDPSKSVFDPVVKTPGVNGSSTQQFEYKIDIRTGNPVEGTRTQSGDAVVIHPQSPTITRGTMVPEYSFNYASKNKIYTSQSWAQHADAAMFGYNSVVKAVNDSGLSKYMEMDPDSNRMQLTMIADEIAKNFAETGNTNLTITTSSNDKLKYYVVAQADSSGNMYDNMRVMAAEAGAIMATNIGSTARNMDKSYGIGLHKSSNGMLYMVFVSRDASFNNPAINDDMEVYYPEAFDKTHPNYNSVTNQVDGYIHGDKMLKQVLYGYNHSTNAINEGNVDIETGRTTYEYESNSLANQNAADWAKYLNDNNIFQHSVGQHSYYNWTSESLAINFFRDAGTPVALGVTLNFHAYGLGASRYGNTDLGIGVVGNGYQLIVALQSYNSEPVNLRPR